MGGRITYDEYRYRQTDAALQPRRKVKSISAWNCELLRLTCHECNAIAKVYRGYLMGNLVEIRKDIEDVFWLTVYCPWEHHIVRQEKIISTLMYFEPKDEGKEVIVKPLPVIHRPPRKGGNFLKAAMIKAASAKVKIIKVRPNVDLPAGTATVLDVEYQGEPYGFPLNVTNHRMLCQLFGDAKAETFDSAKLEGETITLKKVMANNPREHKEVETLRIAE